MQRSICAISRDGGRISEICMIWYFGMRILYFTFTHCNKLLLQENCHTKHQQRKALIITLQITEILTVKNVTNSQCVFLYVAGYQV